MTTDDEKPTRVPPSLDNLTSPQQQMITNATEMAENIKRFQEQLSTVQPAVTRIGQVLQYIPVISPAILDAAKVLGQIAPVISNLAYWFQEHKRLKKIASCFSECGLWLAPSMTSSLIQTVVERYDEGKKRSIPLLIDGFYRRGNWASLKNTVDSWVSYKYFRPRMRIFEEALEAHVSGKYILSIPTLLPHIEGIAREIAFENNLPACLEPLVVERGAKTRPSGVFAQLPANVVTPTMDVAIESLLYYLEGTMYISNVDFDKELPKLRGQRMLNRHAILHGCSLGYSTRLNSLRCFLALDSLSMLEGNIPELLR